LARVAVGDEKNLYLWGDKEIIEWERHVRKKARGI